MDKLLTSLSVLAARTSKSEQRIHDAAVARLGEVNARLESIRPDAVLHAGDEYQLLILERGRLNQVLAQAKGNGAAG
jgi:hypothetical protein